MSNYDNGHLAEFLALSFLKLKGYNLICRNYVTGRGTGAGEVDIILSKGKTIVFIEVKKRSSLEQAAYAVLPKQQERIRRAAEAFLAKNPQYNGYDVRFDVVLVSFPLRIKHIENAF